MRYVMWIAELSESSNLWTHIALSRYSWEHASLRIDSSSLYRRTCYVWQGKLSGHTIHSWIVRPFKKSGLQTEGVWRM